MQTYNQLAQKTVEIDKQGSTFMKVSLEVGEDTIPIDEKATVLDLILLTHQQCRENNLPFPTHYSISYSGGYYSTLSFHQFELAERLQEITKITGSQKIMIQLDIFGSMMETHTHDLAILSFPVLCKKMSKIIKTILNREIQAAVQKKQLTKKIADIAPKTIHILTTLETYNKKTPKEYQLMSNDKIAIFKKLISNSRVASLTTRYKKRSHSSKLRFDEYFTLQQQTDWELKLPLDDDSKDKSESKQSFPPFVADLQEFFADIQSKRKTYKNHPALKFIELRLHNLMKIFKETGSADKKLISKLSLDLYKLVIMNDNPLLEQLIKKENFFQYLKTEYSDSKKVFSLAILIRKNLVNNIELLTKLMEWDFSIDIFDYFENAIDNHAIESAKFLLKKCSLTSSQLLGLGKLAIESGNLAMVKLIFPDQPLFYFNDVISEIKEKSADILSKKTPELACTQSEKFFLFISNAYRNSSIDTADEVCNSFIQYLEETYTQAEFSPYIANLKTSIKKAQDAFKKWRSQIAWYFSTRDISDLRAVYGDLSDHSELIHDIKLGTKKNALIQQLCERELKTEGNKFNLPICPPPKKFYSMQQLLQIMSEFRAELAGDREWSQYNQSRPCPCPGTDCTGRYQYMQPWIEIMATGSNNSSFTTFDTGYELLYGGEVLSVVKMLDDGTWKWQHGATTLDIREKIWRDIERLNTKLFDLDQKSVLENIGEFYQNVIEVIWLMGNLQLTPRGTGCHVELWFELIHRYFQFPEVPKLKIGQLDCYDITFSLPVYKKILFYFFDPKSLHPKLLQAMQEQYANDEETRYLVKKFNLTVPPGFSEIKPTHPDKLTSDTPPSPQKTKSSLFFPTPSGTIKYITCPSTRLR